MCCRRLVAPSRSTGSQYSGRVFPLPIRQQLSIPSSVKGEEEVEAIQVSPECNFIWILYDRGRPNKETFVCSPQLCRRRRRAFGASG